MLKRSRMLPQLLHRTRGLGVRLLAMLSLIFMLGLTAWGENKPSPVPNMFAPTSTPAHDEIVLSYFVIGITMGILAVVGGSWLYVVFKYRSTDPSDAEPPQVYGSPQVELAWTIVPVLIVVVLFLTTARMIFAIQDHSRPKDALDVTVVGHQFWWEYRYPKYGVVTANELHVPMSTPGRAMPTFMTLQSADVWHSWWVPQLAGKVDNIPDHVNNMWIEPTVPGVYVGQCGQFCGVEHAKMLIRVYVDTPDQFQRWITRQQQPAVEDGTPRETVPTSQAGVRPAAYNPAVDNAPMKGESPATAEIVTGRQVFLTNACMNCHAIDGTAANGHFGPNLTHFGSRDTLGSGAIANNMDNLKNWIRDPSSMKEGALMPPMQLTEPQLEQVSAYLTSLK